MGGSRSTIGSFSNLRRNRCGGYDDRDLSTKVLYSITPLRLTADGAERICRTPVKQSVVGDLLISFTDLPFSSPSPDNGDRRRLPEERLHRYAPDLCW